jgi:RNA-binding protein YlmH
MEWDLMKKSLDVSRLNLGDVLVCEHGLLLMIVDNNRHEFKCGLLNLRTNRIDINYYDIDTLKDDIIKNNEVNIGNYKDSVVLEIISSENLVLSLKQQ